MMAFITIIIESIPFQKLPARVQCGGEGAGHPGPAGHPGHGEQREAGQAEHPDLSLTVLSQVCKRLQPSGPSAQVPAKPRSVKKCGIEVTADT